MVFNKFAGRATREQIGISSVTTTEPTDKSFYLYVSPSPEHPRRQVFLIGNFATDVARAEQVSWAFSPEEGSVLYRLADNKVADLQRDYAQGNPLDPHVTDDLYVRSLHSNAASIVTKLRSSHRG